MPFDGVEIPADVKLLLLARQHIIERGWCQDSVFAPDGRVCVIGALQRVSSVEDRMSGAYDGAIARLAKAIRHPHGGPIEIGCWNDKPKRSLADVLSALDRAAIG